MPEPQQPPSAVASAAVQAPRPLAATGPGRASHGGGAVMGIGGDVVQHTITPHSIMCAFKDDKLRMRVGAMILLPSGVVDVSMLKSKVMPDGRSYCLDMLIPDAVTHPEKFLRLFRASPKAMADSGGERNAAFRESAFHEKMSTMRTAKHAPVWRRFTLPLDFQVVEDIAYIKLNTLEGSYFLYVEFMAQEKSSYMHDGMIEDDGVMDLNSPDTNLDRKRKAM